VVATAPAEAKVTHAESQSQSSSAHSLPLAYGQVHIRVYNTSVTSS
jgi:hypothetical protein